MLADGYKVTHKGLLYWTPLPRAGIVPTARLRFVGLEGLMAQIFYANKVVTIDHV